MRTDRLDWVDTAKGIGIVAVVAGHVFHDRHVVDGIYLWHMPLFFFLSGYLFSPRPVPMFARQKARHLLLPYVSFLLLLSMPPLLSGDLKHVARMIFGGRALTGPWGTFWFVPVLYVTQQLANALLPRLSVAAQALAAVACLAAAFLVPPGSLVPLALDVVLMAFPIFWVGTLCKGQQPDARWISGLGLIGLALCAAGAIPPLDMKGGRYGYPGVTLALSLAAVHLVCQISAVRSVLSDLLQALGRASITIMFVHPAAFMWLRDDAKMTSNEAVLFAVALGIPFALHRLLERAAVTRRLFLGQDRRPLGTPAAPRAEQRAGS